MTTLKLNSATPKGSLNGHLDLFLWAVGVIVSIGLLGLVVYVACHFLGKVW